MTMKKDLTTGDVSKSLLAFAGPMILGNLLQQCYNIADTFIVGRFLGADALAAVGAAYTLMTFLTSILIGLCMGSSSLFSDVSIWNLIPRWQCLQTETVDGLVPW